MNHYYISTGEQTKMYTLRHSFSEPRQTVEGIIYIDRDNYCQNLSTDWETAVKKAKSLTNKCDDPLHINSEFSLQEIRRREEEEIEAARVAKVAAEEAIRNSRIEKHLMDIEFGIFPFGKYTGKKFEDVREYDAGYIQYMGNITVEENDPVPELMKKVLNKRFPELFKPLPEANGEYYGEVKSREQFTATIIAKFGFEGFYGWTNIIKMVKDSGEVLVYMGSASKEGEKGDVVTFTATIKEHELYEGEKQTKVNRPAKWEVIK